MRPRRRFARVATTVLPKHIGCLLFGGTAVTSLLFHLLPWRTPDPYGLNARLDRLEDASGRTRPATRSVVSCGSRIASGAKANPVRQEGNHTASLRVSSEAALD